MIVWIDAQLSPALALWLAANFEVTAYSARFLGLRDSQDEEIFAAARAANAVVLTKDRDFVLLVERLGPPPQVIWITCGNTSNARLRQVLTDRFSQALELLRRGEPVIEISDRRSIG